ncbi:hypothetical protein KNSL1_013616 [Colletotrichum chrysophilum]|nr:hypothetical protein KNSL1_013616 [Colletotrichum chrysophilum]
MAHDAFNVAMILQNLLLSEAHILSDKLEGANDEGDWSLSDSEFCLFTEPRNELDLFMATGYQWPSFMGSNSAAEPEASVVDWPTPFKYESLPQSPIGQPEIVEGFLSPDTEFPVVGRAKDYVSEPIQMSEELVSGIDPRNLQLV